MIYTVTLNPALDCVMFLEDLKVGGLNRASSQEIFAGGKGINVSYILNELEVDNTALGFVAGFTGVALEHQLKSQGISTDFVHLSSGLTRINVKIESGTETEINGTGAVASYDEQALLLDKLSHAKAGDYVVLAGSIPGGMDADIYRQIVAQLAPKGVRCVVDSSAALLLPTLEHGPFIIKPNRYELGEIFNTVIRDMKQVISYGKKLHEMGAANVCISLDRDGCVLINREGVFHVAAPCGEVINSVGAGDSFLAGLLAGYIRHNDWNEALRLGIAAGSATAFSRGLATGSEITALLNKISV